MEGQYIPSDDDEGSLTGATFVVDPATGLVSAEIVTENGGVIIPYAKLDGTKTLLPSVLSEGPEGRGLSVGIKGGETFAQADLAGTWYFSTLTDYREGNNPGWTALTITFDENGSFVSGGFTTSDNESAMVDFASFIVEENGLVSGWVAVGEGGVDFPFGKLNTGKNILAFVGSEWPEGRALSVGIKAGGTFTSPDLAGTWYLVELGDHPTANGPFWSAATVTVDATGTITGGIAMNSMGEPVTITGGSLSMDAAGLLSGSATATGGSMTFSYGKLDAGKGVLTMVVTESEGDVGIMVGIKGSPAAPPAATLVSPTGPGIVATPDFTWNAVPGAT